MTFWELELQRNERDGIYVSVNFIKNILIFYGADGYFSSFYLSLFFLVVYVSYDGYFQAIKN